MVNELSFKMFQEVRHIKSGNVYQIAEVPDECKRLEYCNEPYYAYFGLIRYGTKNDYWVRKQSEMEDGRFEAL